METLNWNPKAKEIFERVIFRLPQFHRSIAQRLVKESAEMLAKERKAQEVEEEDLIKAFFKEVPPAFKEMMQKLFDKLNIPYKNYIEE